MCACVCVDRERENKDSKELDHSVVKPKFFRHASRWQTQGRVSVAAQTWRPCWQDSFLLRGGHTLFSLRPATDWRRPTHRMKGNRFYSKSTDISSKSIQCRIILDLISRHHKPAKWAHKVIITLCLGILKDGKKAVWLKEKLGGTWCRMKQQRQQRQIERAL